MTIYEKTLENTDAIITSREITELELLFEVGKDKREFRVMLDKMEDKGTNVSAGTGMNL